MSVDAACVWAGLGEAVEGGADQIVGMLLLAEVLLVQPAREARWLAQRAERSRRDLSALWASWRASAQAVTSKWHFRTTSPINTASSAGEN